jgi:hypothetical protein
LPRKAPLVMAKADHDHDNLGGSNKILNLDHAAELLDMPPARLRKHWREWGIPAYKAGRELRFTERDLRAWFAKRAVAA